MPLLTRCRSVSWNWWPCTVTVSEQADSATAASAARAATLRARASIWRTNMVAFYSLPRAPGSADFASRENRWRLLPLPAISEACPWQRHTPLETKPDLQSSTTGTDPQVLGWLTRRLDR